MSNLNNRYQQIMKEIRDNITNKEEKEFILLKFQELSVIFMDLIDKLTNLADIKIKEISQGQKEIQNQISKVQKKVEDIENDIYEEDEASYEFEIICPYCNYEFIAEIHGDAHTEIECPECNNIIELDWDGEEYENECANCLKNGVKEDEFFYKKDKKKEKRNKDKKEEENKNNLQKDEDEDM